MNLTEYNAMPEGDLKLAVRTAVAMGWYAHEHQQIVYVFQPQGTIGEVGLVFNPFTDASIPYGLIGQDVQGCMESALGGFYAWCVGAESYKSELHTSKTHAILNAYCQADTMGHWAKFLKGE